MFVSVPLASLVCAALRRDRRGEGAAGRAGAEAEAAVRDGFNAERKENEQIP